MSAATVARGTLAECRSDLDICKWIALVAMTADHVNKHLLAEYSPELFAFGRLAFPIFAAVLGMNLARGELGAAGRWRTIRRLAAVSAIAQIPFVGLGPTFLGWWPLNAMASLLCVALIVTMLERADWRGYAGAVAVFAIGGAMVEFWWPGILIGVGAWLSLRAPGVRLLGWTIFGLGLAGLGWINGNQWALAALPVLAAAKWLPRAPRGKWAFYGYYPMHLTAIWGLQALG